MSFEQFLGNEQIKENLRRSLESGHFSHFYLITGPAGSGKHTLARLLGAAILCRQKPGPCGSCSACRKVFSGSHPDYITVEDPEHKNVAVKIVRQFREDVFIRPNEADNKIYVFPQELGVEGQNTLLKILEEPPAYAVFLMLSDNPQKLLPTVRSRCTELTLRPLEESVLRSALAAQFPKATGEELSAAIARSGGFLGQAMDLLREGTALPPQTEAFARAFAGRKELELVQLLAGMEKWKRDQLIPMLESWVQLLEDALAYRSGIPALYPAAKELGTLRSPAELMSAITALKKGISYGQSNVSPAAVCGWLAWELR